MMSGEHKKPVDAPTEDQRNIEVLRMHAGICSKAVKVEIEGLALKEQAKIFDGAADTIERLTKQAEVYSEAIRQAIFDLRREVAVPNIPQVVSRLREALATKVTR